jgi:transposase
VVALIRIDTLWLCTQPQDMRAGADRLLNIVVNTVGAARAHHGYLFANLRATRLKLLVHDGFGVWCATRRLHAGRFDWPQRLPGDTLAAATLQLTPAQFDALTVGLPWQRLGELSTITRS